VRLVLLGPPGAGKGTQGRRLAGEFGWPLISTGDILRRAVTQKTALGIQAQHQMNQGLLVGDDVMIGLVEERTLESDAAGGYILDGFPRTVPQAAALDAMLASRGQQLDAVVSLAVPEDVILERLATRKREEARADDDEATVRRRIEVYREQTEPLIEYYRAAGRLIEVQGVGGIDAIYRSLQDALGVGNNG
jgi:adenylate kinase